MSGVADKSWSIDIPDQKVLDQIKKFNPEIKAEIFEKLKNDCKMFDGHLGGPRRCDIALYKIDNHTVDGEELYMKTHFANMDKQIRITGFEIWKNN